MLRDISRKFQDYRRRQLGRKSRLDMGEFRKAVNLANTKIIDKIIFDNFEFNIPNLGTLALKKKKIRKFIDGKFNKHLSVDWAATLKHGKKIYHLNEHTDGYKYLLYFTQSIKFKNRNYYRFKIARQNDRYLAKILKNPDIYGKIDAYLI